MKKTPTYLIQNLSLLICQKQNNQIPKDCAVLLTFNTVLFRNSCTPLRVEFCSSLFLLSLSVYNYNLNIAHFPKSQFCLDPDNEMHKNTISSGNNHVQH